MRRRSRWNDRQSLWSSNSKQIYTVTFFYYAMLAWQPYHKSLVIFGVECIFFFFWKSGSGPVCDKFLNITPKLALILPFHRYQQDQYQIRVRYTAIHMWQIENEDENENDEKSPLDLMNAEKRPASLFPHHTSAEADAASDFRSE